MNYIFNVKTAIVIGLLFVSSTPVFAQYSDTLWYGGNSNSDTLWYDDNYSSDTLWYDDYNSDTLWYGGNSTSDTLWYDDNYSSDTLWYDDGYSSDTLWYDDNYSSDTLWYDDYNSDTLWYGGNSTSDTLWYDDNYSSDTLWYDDGYSSDTLYYDDYYAYDSYDDYYYTSGGYYGGGYYGGSLFYTGGGSYYGGRDDDYPVCDEFTASPTRLSSGGGNVTLRWETDDADSVSISGVGSVSRDGSRTVNVNSSRTFTLTARGDGHQVSCNVYVEVDREVQEPLPVCDAFYASPSRVEEGEAFRLSWNTSYGTARINNGIGNVSADGSRTLVADHTETYTLTVTGGGETVDCQTTVTVDEPDAEYPQCNSFYTSPSVLANDGYTTLHWDTTYATSVSINNGVGSVSQDGTRSVYVNNNETFTLTAQNSDGESVNCSTSVTVLDDTPTNHNDLSCDSFYASPSHVEEDEEFRLYWETTDADEVYINNGVGYVNRDGSMRLDTDDDEHYILTARNGSDEVTCHAYVTIDDDDDEDRPRCDLEVSDDRVDRGDRVRISWDNRYAEYIRLRDDNGEEYFDTRHSSSDRREFDEDDDSIYVYVDEDTEFALTVYNDEGTRTCRVDVDVDGSVASASISRTQQPLVAGIALSNVPYTGFEAGPLLTSIFYTILALWGIGIAYLLVVRKKPVVQMSTPVAAPTPVVPVMTESVVPASVPEVKDEVTEKSPLEARAAEERILLAPDALAFIKEQAGTEEEQMYLFNKLVELAKGAFPMEDGWIALDKSRIESIIADA